MIAALHLRSHTQMRQPAWCLERCGCWPDAHRPLWALHGDDALLCTCRLGSYLGMAFMVFFIMLMIGIFWCAGSPCPAATLLYARTSYSCCFP